MASYAGLFSNKYDTRANVNAGIDEMGMDWGRLSQPKYAGMAAAEGMMGYMSGLGNVNNAPEMQKQSLLDEIMAAHPDPKTPEELEALAADLAARGLTDYAFKVREIAQETKAQLTASKTATDKANKPTKDLLDQISFGLSSTVLSEKFITDYMTEFSPNKAGYVVGDETGQITQAQYNNKYTAAKENLENQFKAYRNSISRDKSMTINEVNNLLSSETLLLEGFKEFAKTRGDNERSAWLDKNMVAASTGTGLQGDESEIIPTGTRIDIEKASPTELKKMYDDLLQKSLGTTGFSPSNLNVEEEKLFRQLMEKLGLDSGGNKTSMNDISGGVQTAFSNSPDNQQWFETMLGAVG